MSVWKFLLRLAIGALLVFLLLRKHEVDWSMIVERFVELPVWTLGGALLIDLAGQALCAYRWGLISGIGGRPVRFRQVLPVYFSGMFFNICLPTSIGGDVFRVVGLGRRTGSKTAAFASVFMDRNIGLAALLIVGLLGSLIAQTTVRATFFKQLYEFPIWPIFAALSAGFVLANIALFHERFYHFVTVVFTRLRLGFLTRKLKPLHDAVINYHRPLSVYVVPLLLSVVYQASEVALICLLGYGLHLHLSPWVFCSMFTFQAVAGLLPITFSGVGVREAIFTAVIAGQLGHAYKDEALALSLIYFFGVVVTSRWSAARCT
jgi:uncharacterized protein (TIRG00374 family)